MVDRLFWAEWIVKNPLCYGGFFALSEDFCGTWRQKNRAAASLRLRRFRIEIISSAEFECLTDSECSFPSIKIIPLQGSNLPQTHAKEYFAESFDYWIVHQDNPDKLASLQKVAPRTYSFLLELETDGWID